LEVGQVIRAPDFSFLDALGALEIMDPKTDSGMIVQDEDANELTNIQSLLPEEVIWVMDQLLAREVMYH
jgi:N-alpha-acetyltransferase 35, NatC auxiliary subunit